MDREQIVIDASVALALVRDGPDSSAIRRALTEWLGTDVRLVVPDHFWLEVINPLARRHGYDSRRLLEPISYLEGLPITTIETSRPQLVLTMSLMERHRLTGYDAAYLALAQSIDARLATTDEEMLRAAGELGLDPRLDLGESDGHRIGEGRAPYGPAERPVTWPQWAGAGAYLGTLRRQAMSER